MDGLYKELWLSHYDTIKIRFYVPVIIEICNNFKYLKDCILNLCTTQIDLLSRAYKLMNMQKLETAFPSLARWHQIQMAQLYGQEILRKYWKMTAIHC